MVPGAVHWDHNFIENEIITYETLHTQWCSSIGMPLLIKQFFGLSNNVRLLVKAVKLGYCGIDAIPLLYLYSTAQVYKLYRQRGTHS